MKTSHVWRTAIEGLVVEMRWSGWGSEELLGDGRTVARRRLGLRTKVVRADVVDAAGRPRRLEVTVAEAGGWRIGSYVLLVSLDGVPRARLEPLENPGEPARACLHCGYSLAGLEAAHGEIRCPGCGRHTPESLVGGPDAPGPPGPLSRSSASDTGAR